MHVLLHHPHNLHRALAAGLVAAVLAIVVTLAVAGGLGDLGSGRGSVSFAAPYQHALAQPAMVGPLTGNPFSHGSLARPFAMPLPMPPLVTAANQT